MEDDRYLNSGKGHPGRITHSSYGTGSAEGIGLKIYDASGRLVGSFDPEGLRTEGQLRLQAYKRSSTDDFHKSKSHLTFYCLLILTFSFLL
jgi:hypothetical protein